MIKALYLTRTTAVHLFLWVFGSSSPDPHTAPVLVWNKTATISKARWALHNQNESAQCFSSHVTNWERVHLSLLALHKSPLLAHLLLSMVATSSQFSRHFQNAFFTEVVRSCGIQDARQDSERCRGLAVSPTSGQRPNHNFVNCKARRAMTYNYNKYIK